MRRAFYLLALITSAFANGCITGPSQGSAASATPTSSTSGKSDLLDDFETGSAKSGSAWAASADQNNLGSQAHFEMKDGGAEGKGRAGYFAGHLGKNVAPWPWASLSVGMNAGQSATDISSVKAIRFMVKGDGKTYKLALPRDAVKDYANFHATFEAPSQWTKVEIPLDKLTQPDWGQQLPKSWADVRALEFSPTVTDADFEIYIDNVEFVVDESKPSPFAPKEEAPVHVDGKSLLVDDFDGKGPSNGAVWGAEMDMNNLGTIAVFRNEPSGDAERKLAAHFKGKLGKNQKPWPWATLSINVDPNATPTDFSGVKAVRFWAKGNGEQFRLAVTRKAVTDYGHYGYNFTMPSKWTQITVPLERLGQADWAVKVAPGWSDVVAVQWAPVAGDAPFDVWVDNVELVTDPAKAPPFKSK